MKKLLQISLLGVLIQIPLSLHAATNRVYVDQARDLAEKMNVPFNDNESLLPQVLELRDLQREKIFEISRMTSPHSASCKRARRQLMEVNSLVRKLRVAIDR